MDLGEDCVTTNFGKKSELFLHDIQDLIEFSCNESI